MAVICPDFKWFLNPAVVAWFVKASVFYSVNSAPSVIESLLSMVFTSQQKDSNIFETLFKKKKKI